jgi:uncharacterized protein YbbC (DUF1343 family)
MRVIDGIRPPADVPPALRRSAREAPEIPSDGGKPMDRQIRRQSFRLLVLALLAACAPGDPGGARDSAGSAPLAGSETNDAEAVRPGALVLLEDRLDLVRGRRVGLVTNHTGIVRDEDGAVQSTIDLFHAHPEVELVALFGPEHGIRGTAEAGEAVDSSVDGATGLPVHSLYGGTRKPTPEMLEGVEVLLFDIQDIGTRYYTYVWTMTLAMEAAAEAGIPFVVLDRPDPVRGDVVQGNVLDPEYSTFVGRFAVPMRHGLTPGEMARLVAGEFGSGNPESLEVVPVTGWRRSMTFGDTGLPWVAPSPNMPDVVSALHYPGTCLFEGTVLSVARGTDRPFQQIGAPWLDAQALAQALNGYGLPDVRFEPVEFVPESPGDGKFGGETVRGVRFVSTGGAYDPTRAAVAALIEAYRLAGDRWSWREAHFDRLAGTDAVRIAVESGAGLDEITADWDRQLAEFRERRAPYLMY